MMRGLDSDGEVQEGRLKDEQNIKNRTGTRGLPSSSSSDLSQPTYSIPHPCLPANPPLQQPASRGSSRVFLPPTGACRGTQRGTRAGRPRPPPPA
ncbi:hypothetical protein Pmani_040086 [Petrolisthes manimaculis]|uniref:Uncharacterized protein n=1 Tax=Petrolisthes manimaculis TaxID=1843537 RepID=A0AAE1NCT5_9EUCA|nr:hypothetical protein Pmani_040086 [Petrolisthes manimaculis]